MDDNQSPPERFDNKTGGCLWSIFIFVAASIGITIAVILTYGLLIEQWNLIAVPREFGFDMILYAPLIGLLVGSAVTYFALQNRSLRKIWIAALIILIGLFIVLNLLGFSGLGLFY